MSEGIVVTISQNDLKYPSDEESALGAKQFPDFYQFKFEQTDIFDYSKPNVADAKRLNKVLNLNFYSDAHYAKTLILKNSFINAYVNYTRGIPLKAELFAKEHYVNLMQFQFYAETTYYFIFSLRDYLLQIINIYFDNGLRDDKVTMKKICDLNKGSEIGEMLHQFDNSLKNGSDLRNTLTHRYPIHQPDTRSTTKEVNGVFRFAAGTGRKKSSQEIMDNIIESANELATFSNWLKNLINPT